MSKRKYIVLLTTAMMLAVAFVAFTIRQKQDSRFITYRVDPRKHEIKLYWRDDKNVPFKNIGNLESWLNGHGEKLVFAMNAGMFKPDNSPVGLYMQQKKTITPLDTSGSSGNFYLKPNGIFYITTGNKAIICKTEEFKNNGQIKYATQSGPMLVIDGKIHPAFGKGSANTNIRNGVGILPNGDVIFAISKVKINFYDFAEYFKDLGCRNALYLDGFISKVYVSEQGVAQTDGNLGVMFGVTSTGVRKP